MVNHAAALFVMLVMAEPAPVRPTATHSDPLPAALAAAAAPKSYPAPRLVDTNGWGAHITRTLSLLATSTATQRNRVKVLVYGQSISKQAWARDVETDLRQRFPHADLVFANRSIGGFISKKLRRTLEHDLIPFYPDLIIFHVYGSRPDYEAVIREIRTRTTAEVIVSNDHVTVNPGQEDHDERSWVWLPSLAKRWHLEFADARRAWVDYMADQHLTPADLVAPDGTHLNDRGNFLLAEVIKRHLIHDPKRPADPHGLVRTVAVGAGLRWQKGRLTLPFVGNRVDVIAARAGAAGDGFVSVQVDGRPPSRHASLYALSRPNADPNRDWPWQVGAVIRVDSREPLLLEDWTIRLTKVDADAARASFDLFGSVTGFDGAGRTDEPFVSRSGRILLSPDDWFLQQAAAKRFAVRIGPGFTIGFRVVPQSVDTWAAPAVMDPTSEGVQTLMQGLAPGPHVLDLIATGGTRPPVAAVRVYRPAFAR